LRRLFLEFSLQDFVYKEELPDSIAFHDELLYNLRDNNILSVHAERSCVTCLSEFVIRGEFGNGKRKRQQELKNLDFCR